MSVSNPVADLPTVLPAGVAALVAVTACEVSLEAPQVGLTRLIEAATEALGGSAGGVWGLEERRLLASCRLPPDDDPGLTLSEAAARRLTEGGTVALGPDEVPEPLRRAGAAAAIGLPVPVGSGVAAALLVGGPEPLAPDSLCRHAAEVAARRMGALLDRSRLRDHLERAMAQILETDERMLGRMGLDIHDGPTQQLSVALLEVQLLEAELDDVAERGVEVPEAVRAGLERIYETLGGALHEMRELIGHLRPAQFDDRRLSDVLQDAITAFEQRTDTTVTVRFEGEFPKNGVSITQRITFYRILQETLTNAHRHGNAHQIAVNAREGPAGVTLEVRDDGRGFDPEGFVRQAPGMPLARFGLHGMRDRAQLLGGSFSLWSAPGKGTHVRVFLPRWRAAAEESADRR